MKHLQTIFDKLRKLLVDKEYDCAGAMLASIEAYVDGDSLFDAGLLYDSISAAADDPAFVREFNKRSGASLAPGFLDDEQPDYNGWDDTDYQKSAGILYGLVLEKGFVQETTDEIMDFITDYLCVDDDAEVESMIMGKYDELNAEAS